MFVQNVFPNWPRKYSSAFERFYRYNFKSMLILWELLWEKFCKNGEWEQEIKIITCGIYLFPAVIIDFHALCSFLGQI